MPSRLHQSHQLQINHIGYQNNEQNNPQFIVIRGGGSDLKTSAPVTLTGPDQTRVPGRPSSNLQQDLRWYLEQFLELPTGAYPELAERVQDTLQQWGKSCFEALFQKQAYLWLQEARQKGLENLHLKISSDDPGVLAWPWEAIHDPEIGTLAHHCRIERQINKDLNDPLPLPENLPKDRINILLVIARPGGDSDVGFHALSRPLVELTREQQLPVHIDVLRPPTFDQLRQQLHDRPEFYHIVHFDGHGGYGATEDSISSDAFKSGAQGRLLFENDEAEAAPVEARLLSELLAEYRIPIMVLNACQSARIDDQAEDAFASVAAALLKAGIRSVMAMGYNLYVSGAQHFMPAFYSRLLETANVAEATRAGRQAMLVHDQRPCLLGEHPLQDWLVPVLYQQMQGDETVLARPVAATPGADKFTLEQDAAPDPLPEQARQLGDDGFIGRQQAVQQLERARLRQPQAAFLIHGMAGVGKTTLAKGFLHWLRDTGGLDQQIAQQVFWFSFDEIRSAEFVINQLIDGIFGTDALAAPLEQKLAGLIKVLKAHPFLLIWDNFESASGLAGTEVRPMLSEDDRGLLKELLAGLRGGKTKVLITSRSAEKWLSTGECFRLPLSGLHGEELWQFCNQVLRDLGLTVRRDDEDFRALIEELDGHPLALRTVLLQLKDKGAKELLADLRKEFALLEGDESGSRILAALAVLDQGLPEEYGPVLQLIGLHRRFVEQNYLAQYMLNTEENSEPIQNCFALLETAGLVNALGSNIFQMHPALQSHLERQHPATEGLKRAFVDFMGSFADQLALKELHEQRIPFALHQGNFHHALELAQHLGMAQDITALTTRLAAYALNSRDYAGAAQLFANLVEHHQKEKNYIGEARCYHDLGRIAEEQRDFAAAKKWYKTSLAIFEKHGNEHDAAVTYHHIGIIAEERRDFTAAEQWYKKSLTIFNRQGNEHEAAATYHQLGSIAQKQRNFVAAEQWYKKSLTIEEEQGTERGASVTLHQLGRIAEEQRDFATAKQWYVKSLEIKEKQGDEPGSAMTYHHLGIIAQEQQEFVAAENWYKKSLTLKEKQSNEHGAASTYHQLGQLALLQKDYASAGEWYLKAMPVFLRFDDPHSFVIVARNFIRALQAADPKTQTILRQNWQQAGLEQHIPLDQLEQKLNEHN
ncbi:MAG: tetratricopeptide repeat protein [Candidatus Electrothrix sp. YB6]